MVEFVYANKNIISPIGDDLFFELSNVLSEKTTNSERINLIREKLKDSGKLESLYHADEKNDEKAEKYKELGNKFFKKEVYDQALHCYTKSIMRAKSQKLLALGYGNRSAVLFKLEMYKECLSDIQQALSNDYPESLQPNLLSRKSKAKKFSTKSQSEHLEDPFTTYPKTSSSPIRHISDCVEMRTKDHCVVAKKPIQSGDIIIMEEPQTIATSAINYLIHCHQCLNLCYNPIPCPSCTKTLYCSETCKDKALGLYHKSECSILRSFYKLVKECTFALLPLRIILGLKDKELDSLLAQAKVPSPDPELTILSIVLCELIKNHTKIFEGEAIEILFMNYFTQDFARKVSPITECVCIKETSELFKMELAGYGVYPSFTWFKHSCFPNVCIQYFGANSVIRALTTIKKGEKCVLSYGYNYMDEEKELRREDLLRIFNFNCTCRACKEDWPRVDLKNNPLSARDEDITRELMRGNVGLIKRILSEKIEKVKALEGSLPSQDFSSQLQILMLCFYVLANKRHIL